MTPQERAKDVCHRAGWTIEPWVYDIIVRALTEAVADEHARIVELAEAIESGTYTTTRTVAHVLRAEKAEP